MEEKKTICVAAPGQDIKRGPSVVCTAKDINEDGSPYISNEGGVPRYCMGRKAQSHLVPPDGGHVISVEDAKLIHQTLANESDEDIDVDAIREELVASGDTGTVKINVNPINGEQVGEPDISDEDIKEIILGAVGNSHGLPEDYRKMLVECNYISEENLTEIEELLPTIDIKVDIRGQVHMDVVNRLIPDDTVNLKEGQTIIDAKYDYLASLKEISVFDMDNMNESVIDKVIMAVREKYGVSTDQLADASKIAIEAKLKKLKAKGASMYEINKYEAKLKTLNIDFKLSDIDDMLDGRAKFLARDYMSNRAWIKELQKFEKLCNTTAIKLPSLEYLSAAIDATVFNTTKNRLEIITIRKFMYMLIRATTTRTATIDYTIAKLGCFITTLYSHTHAINTLLKNDKSAEIPVEHKVFGVDLFWLITKYTK